MIAATGGVVNRSAAANHPTYMSCREIRCSIGTGRVGEVTSRLGDVRLLASGHLNGVLALLPVRSLRGNDDG